MEDDSQETKEPFGLRFYEEMRSAGLMHWLTRRLSYAEMQELKKADREGVLAMFPLAPYAFRKLLRTADMDEIGATIRAEKQKGEMALAILLAAWS